MIDLRSIRVGIEISGRMHYYESKEGMRIRASGTKHANATQNDCTVILSNLKRETRDFLITETSPFNDNSSLKRIIVEAGRVQLGVFQLFVGDIVSAEPSSPPDVDITIHAKTGANANTRVISTSSGARTNLSEIAREIASGIGVDLDFQAVDKLISNFTYTGGALGQISRLSEAGGVRAFLDDMKLLVQDRDKATAGRVKLLNLNSGMIGLPKITETGVEVLYLIDGESALGGTLQLESQFNKAANGSYKIDQLSFEVASHEEPFFYKAICSRI